MLLALAPFWMPPLGGYTALGTRVLVLALAAMSVNFLLGFTGVLSLRPCRLFRPRRLWRGLCAEIPRRRARRSRCSCGMLLGGIAGALLGALIVRRRGVYFAMVTIAFGQVFYYIAFQWSSLTGGDDGLRGFSRQPLASRPALDRYPAATPMPSTISCSSASRSASALMALLLRSPFGRTHGRDPRERAPGALPRHPGRAAHLDRLHALLLLRRLRRRALCAAQQFRRPARPALQPVRRFRDHGGDGRHAHVLGAAAGRRVFVVLQDYLSSITVNWMSLVGLLFVLVVLFFPRGLLGFLQRRSAA